jgi:hypothetical protein
VALKSPAASTDGRRVDRGMLEGDAIGLVRGMLGWGFLSRKA